MSPALLVARIRVRVRGVVQGVGFRPHVFRQAERFAMTGWVLNDAEGVLLEAQGTAIAPFVAALRDQAPPLARIDALEAVEVPCREAEATFAIHTSDHSAAVRVAPPGDTAVCPACLDELFDPQSRFFGYPFLNCTDCGPRYTLIRSLPYDRPATAMAGFAMCAACQAEYHDPRDRRFHAQPTACARCGPRLSMPPAEIAQRLLGGQLLALKGIGGYHLVCDARQEEAVARLRRAKRREAKPFAVMVANLASAERIAQGAREAADLLRSRERPIVILPRLAMLAPSVSPDLPSWGVMLPYAPLHYLLFHEAAGRPAGTAWREQPQELVLVVTSANFSGDPLVIEDDQARARFAGVVDAVVTHDRPIVVRADDSVVRPTPAGPLRVRNGRGHAPTRVALGRTVPGLIALGASLKATVCLVRADEAFVSEHLGDLESGAAIEAYEQAVERLLALLELEPTAVAHDLHPDFASSRLAQRLGVRAIAVQHHHAHVAAVMAEHGLAGPVLGLALDGFGLGPSGELWGGELLLAERDRCERLGGLRPLPLPGGDAAAREPWRMAAAALHVLGRGHEIARRWPDRPGAPLLARMLETGLNSPWTSSAGRLFDAAAGLLGVCEVSGYEGQAAMLLESLAQRPTVDPALWCDRGDALDLHPLLAALIDRDPVEGANLFHGTLAAAWVAWARRHAAERGLGDVVLAGGCMLNQVLVARLSQGLQAAGLRVHTARELPPHDGALSLGQAWIAAYRIEDPSCV